MTLAVRPSAVDLERVLLGGDLSPLSPAQKLAYYRAVCDSIGLNPLTKPFDYLLLDGKEVLYARRDATDQLRKLHQISVAIVARELQDEIYVVTARASMRDGRCDESIGAVAIGGLKGTSRANALMKCETKAKRRVTLSICGLGMLDETEIESIPGAQPNAAPVVPVAPPTRPGRPSPPPGQDPEPDDEPEDAPDDTPPEDEPDADDSGRRVPPRLLTQYGVAVPEDGQTYVVRVDCSDTKNPNVKKYRVTLSTGESGSTIKTRLGLLADDCCRQLTPVRATWVDTKWGPDLSVLERVATASDPIPF